MSCEAVSGNPTRSSHDRLATSPTHGVNDGTPELESKRGVCKGIPHNDEMPRHDTVSDHVEYGSPSHPRSDLSTEELERAQSEGNGIRSTSRPDVERAQTNASLTPLHSAFSKRERYFIISMAAAAGFFSPLSANIYFPALNPLAADLHVSGSLINVSLTTYMIFQGLAPTVFGDLADAAGRRPVYIVGFVLYIGACVGLALQTSVPALLVLRCLQSTGSSSTIALASGVVADVATSAERGAAMGWVTGGSLLGPAVGPILGGVLAEFLGWRSIFWFLVILAGIFMVPLVLAFPETGRNVVGNGSIPPGAYNMTLLNIWKKRRKPALVQASSIERTESKQSARSARHVLPNPRRLQLPNPLNTLKVVFEKDVGMLLLFNSLVYTAFYDVAASTPYLFARTYGFNDLQIGLSYLPFGFGCFLAPVINGRLMDWNFRRVARARGIPIRKGRTNDLRSFPLEEARVPIALPLIFVGDAALLSYGWTMHVNAHLAAPLVLQFIIGLTLSGGFNVMSTMLVDYYPMRPSTATAANNLVRCLMGAGGTAVIIYMIEAMGRGWCFTFVSGVVLATTPILVVLRRWGPAWREQRMARADVERVAAEKSEAKEKRIEDG